MKTTRETYSVEITTPGLGPVRAVGIATFVCVPGNAPMRRGGGSGWNTCGHDHRSWGAAVRCGRIINAKAGVPNQAEFS